MAHKDLASDYSKVQVLSGFTNSPLLAEVLVHALVIYMTAAWAFDREFVVCRREQLFEAGMALCCIVLEEGDFPSLNDFETKTIREVCRWQFCF